MLLNELMKDVMEQRNISLHDVSTLTEIKESKLRFYLDGAIPTPKHLQMIIKGLNIDENDITYDDLSMSVNECAIKMGTGSMFVRNAIEKGRLPGICLQNGKNKTFHIPRLQIYTYLGMQSNSHYLTVIQLLEEALKKSLPTDESVSDNR